MNKYGKLALLAVAFAAGLFVLYEVIYTPPAPDPLTPYSEFIYKVKSKNMELAEISGPYIKFRTRNGEESMTVNPNDPHLVDYLLAGQTKIKTLPPSQPSFLMQILISWAPTIILIGIFIWYMRSNSRGNGTNGFGKSKAKILEIDTVNTKFADVAGCEEAKEEVEELVDFLKDPAKYQTLGGKIPKGVLMVGPPGTGKTLIARAIAGEAGVKFITTSGSDFVEMFVGVGASRVRDMFEQAKKNAPCIIFIDEIDAVAKQRRSGGLGGGNDEGEQTLNQLLVEMDGFEGTEGIIIIGATNRVDTLDKAILRPGRFDRQVTVGLPDIKGRQQILEVHIKKVPASNDVNLFDLARGTPGFSGADLANLVNEAALFAARNNLTEVGMRELEKAKDKILMGVEKHTMVMSDDVKLLTAYHEAGHCVVGQLSDGHNPVYKVSIMPRGRALGVTMFLPEEDEYSINKTKLESQIASLFGGRIAEHIIYGDEKVTTGASNDIERATELARNMVTRWGLSAKLGPMVYGEESGSSMFGQPGAKGGSISGDTSRIIDQEIRSIIDRNYQRAESILQDNIDVLHNMAQALMAFETIDKSQIDELMAGKELVSKAVVLEK